MANTYELIASTTVGAGGASSIDFTSIASTWTDLIVKYSTRTSVASPYANLFLRLNGSTSSYSMIRIYGDGSSASSYSNSDIFDVTDGDSATSNTFGSGEYLIPNYAGSTYKSTSGESANEQNASTAQLLITGGLWSNSAAITQVSLVPTSGTFKQYSTAYLYGVKNA